MTHKIINDEALDIIFRTARTFNKWQEKPVSDITLQAVYDLMKLAPTSANCSPVRIVFVQSAAAKEKLKPCLDAGNIDKTMTAPVTAILAQDMKFYNQMPILFPHTDAKAWFVGNDAKIQDTAFRNSSLQAAYFILAARAVGLDTGPMSGFDAEMVGKTFLSDTPDFKANMLCNIGYGDASGMYPRLPKLGYDQVCRVV